MTFKCAGPQASFVAAISSNIFAWSPARKAPRSMTMSISSAPSATARRTSSSLVRKRILATGETGGDGGDVHGRIFAEKFPRVFHHVRINANGGARRHVVFRLDGLERLAAEIGDFAGRVFAFERGEVHMLTAIFSPASLAEVLMLRLVNDAARSSTITASTVGIPEGKVADNE